MRVFVAFACPAPLLPDIRRCQQQVRDVPGVRLLDEAGLHLTLVPPWEEKDPDAVLRDFAAVEEPAVRLTLGSASYHASRGGLVGVIEGATTDAAERLRLKAYRAILSHDPARPFIPHVSFARFPSETVLPALPLLAAKAVVFDRLCLYASLGDLSYRVIGERRLPL